MCMNGKLKSSRKIFAPFFPSPQSFDTVTLDDDYSHVEDGYKRQTPPNDYQPLSLLLSSTTSLYPTPSYEVISDSNTKPWKLSSPTVRICCGNISGDGGRTARENGPIILDRYTRGKKMEKKNSRDIIVTRLSFDFILPNHYCPSARHSRVKRYWKKCWRWMLIIFPLHGRSNALHA